MQKILFSNIGYARGIDGTLWQHLCRFTRHVYCGMSTQEQVLQQLKSIILNEQPDLCCFVEIDQGSFYSENFNQIKYLVDKDYHFHDVTEKYGLESRLRSMPLHKGKSNGFIAKSIVQFEHRYFTKGTKRLLYHIVLPGDIHVLFGHFSLNKSTRGDQLREMNKIIKKIGHPVIVLADFNIMHGFHELQPLIDGTDLHILNKETDHTFTFHKTRLALDVCLCSASLVDRMKLTIVPQPFSDHAALLVEVQ